MLRDFPLATKTKSRGTGRKLHQDLSPSKRACLSTIAKLLIPSTAVNGTLDTLGSTGAGPEGEFSLQRLSTPTITVDQSTAILRTLDSVLITGSAYPGFTFGDPYDEPRHNEQLALNHLLPRAHARQGADADNFAYITIDNFTVYRSPGAGHHATEMVTLDRLHQHKTPNLCVDGRLSVGPCSDADHHVRGILFATHAVGGYGDPEAVNLANLMYIQSPLGRRHNVWYRLGSPALEYRRFYNPFLWLARFTKHFVDHLLARSCTQVEAASPTVRLSDFRKDFYLSLLNLYGAEASFVDWCAAGPGTDFRSVIAAHYAYLWRESYNVNCARGSICDQPIWHEILPASLGAIEMQPNQVTATIVTPYAYGCFHRSYFGKRLLQRPVTGPVLEIVVGRKQRLNLTPLQCDAIEFAYLLPAPTATGKVVAGDVVCVQPDDEKTTSWRSSASIWYAYVQAIRSAKDGPCYDVLWLYTPCDTTIGKAAYPFPNELFLSDNCSCGKRALHEQDILGTVPVSWCPQALPRDRHFIRQRFRTAVDDDHYNFTALGRAALRCQCDAHVSMYDQAKAQYCLNQTVLVREKNAGNRLQPAQILEFVDETMYIKIRRFLKKSDWCNGTVSCPDNELILTDVVQDVSPSLVIRLCTVRSFTAAQIKDGNVATPYDRGGTGDHFFLEAPTDGMGNAFPPFIQGWDPAVSLPKLHGLALFCGGGNLDRGLEEGGAVEFRHAVDWDTAAMHSYRANLRRPDRTELFLGSVDDYLQHAMAGGTKLTARPGEVDVISAGSPCPGFSALQQHKLSLTSIRNASMVASVVSFVNFYVPRYFILENVVTMTQGTGPDRSENVFSQIVAALVGLGYQVQQFLLDAWSYGSPQQRSRVFVIASVPGAEPFVAPPHLHSHPTVMSSRSLGRSSNGLPFGNRRHEYTAFHHSTPLGACADLPKLDDSQVQLTPSFPDHRTPSEETATVRGRMAVVPTYPRGMGIVDVYLNNGL